MAELNVTSRCELNCCGCDPTIAIELRDPGLSVDGTGFVLGTLLSYCDSATSSSGTGYDYTIFIDDALLTGAILPSDVADLSCYDAADGWLNSHDTGGGGGGGTVQYVDVGVTPEQGYVVLTQVLVDAAKGGTLDIASTVTPSNFIYSRVTSSIQWLDGALPGDPASEEIGLSQTYIAQAGNPYGVAGSVIQVLRGAPDPGSNQFSVRFYFPSI